MRLLNVLPSSVRAMGDSLVGTRKLNKLDISPTLPDGRVRILPNLLATLAKICRPGNHLAGAADPMVGAVEVRPIPVPEAPRTILSTNDNYCVIDPVLVTRSLSVVPSVTETNETVIAQTNVTCSVVSHVHFATKSLRQPEKKGLSPPLRDKRNSVKYVSFVNHCVSVPPVPSVPSVAHAQLVGGRHFFGRPGPSWARIQG